MHRSDRASPQPDDSFMRRASRTVKTRDYGPVATAFESRGSLQTMFLEVQEYFDVGASLSPGATVLDVGANIGAFAIAAAKRCRGQVRMLCFEPVPPLFQALQRNLRENPWLALGDHRAFDQALTSPEEAGSPCEFYYFRRFPRDSTMDLARKREEFEKFFAAQGARAARAAPWLGPAAGLIERAIGALPKGAAGRWMSDRVTGLQRIRVARGTLTGVVASENVTRIDLLKLDVEGSEVRVLAGVEPTTWTGIRQVVVESDGADETTRSLVSLLDARGFAGVRVAESPSMQQRGLRNVLIYASK
jgi:FkbM family methyltransferase